MILFSNFVFSLLILIPKDVIAAKTVAYYCEFGFCAGEQFCCGDNKCCDKLLDTWYFWVGVVIVIVVVALVIFLKYYQQKKRKSPTYKYKLLEESQMLS